MQFIRFGHTGMEVSRLCLGTMTFSRSLDFGGAATVVNEALDAGINFIDTAESYGDSEEFLGRILQGKRDKVYLATKVFTKRAHAGHASRNSRVNLIHSLEHSLLQLRTDHIDLYQLHHPDPDTPINETLSTLDQLIKQGKIRYAGVSNHYAWQMAYMIAHAKAHLWESIVSIQCRYNVLDRVVEIETVPMAKRFRLAMMAYAPLCGGMLSGKYRRGETQKAGSRSAEDTKLQALLSNDRAFDVIDQLKQLASRLSLELNQLAILWLLSKSHVTTPIIGGSRPEHFRSIYAVADRRLSDVDVEEIDKLSESFIYRRFENQPFRDAPEL